MSGPQVSLAHIKNFSALTRKKNAVHDCTDDICAWLGGVNLEMEKGTRTIRSTVDVPKVWSLEGHECAMATR